MRDSGGSVIPAATTAGGPHPLDALTAYVQQVSKEKTPGGQHTPEETPRPGGRESKRGGEETVNHALPRKARRIRNVRKDKAGSRPKVAAHPEATTAIGRTARVGGRRRRGNGRSRGVESLPHPPARPQISF